MKARRPPLRIPLSLIALDGVGALITALGAYGLVSEQPPDWWPALADPAKAWLLIGLGVAMMGYAIVQILKLAVLSRTPARGDKPPPFR